MKNIIVITGASSGFGALAARALAMAGHTVYASMRETTGRNAVQVEGAKQFAAENGVDLRTIELDVASQESADQAIKTIVERDGRLDVIIHNAVLSLSGQIDDQDITELETQIRSEEKGRSIVLDLKDMTLVSRDAIGFLERCEADGVTLRNCAAYVREWITRQRGGS